MAKYISKRILLMIPVLLGITVIVFTLMYFTPGDPTLSILGENVTPEAQAALREQMGLNDPYIVRLGRYIFGLLHGDFGMSYKSKRPVITEILSRYPTTLKLTFGSIVIGTIVGVIFGIISAVRQYSLLDKIATFISLFGVSAPSFWIAMVLVLIFSVKLQLVPATGSYTAASWILPMTTLGLQCGAFIMRMTRSSMLEVIRMDYIRTAKSKGQTELNIILNHAFRNALVPIITTIGIQICGFLAGSVLVESVFALPGLGKYVVDSVSFKDYPAVQGVVLFIAINCVLINLLTDICYCFVDPRIKAQYGMNKRKKNNNQEKEG